MNMFLTGLDCEVNIYVIPWSLKCGLIYVIRQRVASLPFCLASQTGEQAPMVGWAVRST